MIIFHLINIIYIQFMAAARKIANMLNLNNMNPCVKEMQYAVRGPIVIRAAQLEQELKKVSTWWQCY